MLASSHWHSLGGAPAAFEMLREAELGELFPILPLFLGGPPGCWSLGLLAEVNFSLECRWLQQVQSCCVGPEWR